MKNLVSIWSRIITFDCTWVLFAHGSAVVTPADSDDPRQAARDILRQCAEGRGLGSVIGLSSLPGWVVSAAHPDVLTYVSPADVGSTASNLVVAYYGAAVLRADTRELRVVHVEGSRRVMVAKSSSSSPDNGRALR